ncbi:MAG: efflux RND transporter periplasmic adaptor subunit [Sideroxydans sp.]|nr:efflux RND transporter periplasmic adaptor subunit [Sideroxydans sp.]
MMRASKFKIPVIPAQAGIQPKKQTPPQRGGQNLKACLIKPLDSGLRRNDGVFENGFIEISSVVKILIAALLLLGVASAGYWFGTHGRIEEQGLRSGAKAERKLLYYRNPMGLPDTSPVPKKDAMGMDYVAVYEGEDTSTTQLSISTDKVQKLGVQSEAASLRELKRTLRVTGRIEINERHTYAISPKFDGWVERLYVNTTGQAVSKGQPLFEVYSPELVSAQREHALALQGLASLEDAGADAQASMQQLADASAARLKNWDIADAAKQGDASSRVTFRAPVNGVVLDKKAVQGMRFMSGETLYQIADLSSLWVIAEVNEQDIAQVRIGSKSQVTVDAYPGRTFDGKVDFIYPTLNNATRTVQVRIEILNPKGMLKPAMFANAQINTGNSGKVLAVPSSAVIDSGTRQVVLVRLAEGRFEPRAVTLGSRSDDYVEVLSGVADGEQVVTAANFLLDSESNLKAALGGMSAIAPATDVGRDLSRQVGLKPDLQNKTVGHQAQGTLNSINDDGTVSITHQAIPSLKWPDMTMDFALTNSSLVAGIKPGSAISFEIVERTPGEFVITKLQAQHGGH